MRPVLIKREVSNEELASNDAIFTLTDHADSRMQQRNIDVSAVQLVLSYGKIIHSKKARYFVVRKRDIKRLAKHCKDIALTENIQVLVADGINSIITVYRNSDFRQIRPQSRRERRAH